MLNRCGESGNPCLIPDLRWRTFLQSVTFEYDVSGGFDTYGFYYVEVSDEVIKKK